MRANLNALIKQQLVDQFENVVKEEIRQHNLAIVRNDNSLKELQETFGEFYLEHKNLKSTNEALYAKSQKHFGDTKQELEESFGDQRAFIQKNDKRLNKVILEFEQKVADLIDHSLFFVFKTEMYRCFDAVDKQIEVKKRSLTKDIYEAYSKNKSYIQDNRIKSDDRFHSINERFREFDKLLEEYKIDSKGVLRELQAYKKTMFIMEKKIENIYTLIERLNKRMDP